MPIATFKRFSGLLLFAGATLSILPACFSESSGRNTALGGNVAPAPGRAGHGVGGVGDLTLLSAVYGRWVTILDKDGQPFDADVLIRQSIRSDGVNYLLSRNLVSAEETLQILHPAGSASFDQYLLAAQSGLPALAVKGLGSPPPFTSVPRDAAIRLEFSDQLDPATVDEDTVQVMVGEPPVDRHPVRYLVKNDLPGKRGFVLLDPTISSRQSNTLGLPANLIGFPQAETASDANLLIRIPTAVEPAFGQPEVLRDLRRTRTLSPQAGDPLETSPGGAPIVVRAARGSGHLEDHRQPSLVGEFDCTVASVSSPQPWSRQVTWALDAPGCQLIGPRVGDVLESGTALLLLTQVINGTNPAAYEARYTLLEGSFPGSGTGLALPGRIATRYDARDELLQACYLRFTPEPAIALPARGLDPYASVLVKFDEPMDPRSIRALETCVPLSFLYDPNSSSSDPARQFDPAQETVGDFIDRLPGYGPFALGSPNQTGSGRLKFGPTSLDAESRQLTVSPASGWTDAHGEGTGIRLAFALRDRVDGLLDLAGHPLNLTDFVAGNYGQSEPLELDPSVPWPTDRYFALRFNGLDENGDGLAEYSGQYTLQPGVLKGRPLTRRGSRTPPIPTWGSASPSTPGSWIP